MKNLKRFMGIVTVFAMLFTSCSKEDENIMEDPSGKATLSFGAVLNDLVQNKSAFKQAVGDIPSCSADAPAYVDVVLTTPTGGAVVGTLANPLRVNVNPNPGDFDGDGEDEYFTDESASLELEAGTYRLQYFTVLNAAGEVIWAAPISGRSMANFVDQSLPFNFVLDAGVKQYIDVEVLCFEDRLVNEYGYLFFDIEKVEAFEFCFFANFCTPDGRHYPAAYSVDISVDGQALYSGVMNTVGIGNENDPYNDNDPYADPLCFVLPNLAQYADGEEYIDYTITLMDWEGVYGDVEQVQMSGSLSRAEIMANYVGDDDVNYQHFRFGCGDDDEQPAPDVDNDGIPNATDNCPNTSNPNQLDSDDDGIGNMCDACPNEAGDNANGCPDEEEPQGCEMEAADNNCGVGYLSGENGWIEITEPNGLPEPLYINEPNGDDPWSSVAIVLNNGNPLVLISSSDGFDLDDYMIEVSDGNDGLADACLSADNISEPQGDDPDVIAQFTASMSYPFYVKIKANVCAE